jgi:hypothetical protein
VERSLCGRSFLEMFFLQRVAHWRDLQFSQIIGSYLSIRVAILPESNRPPLVIPNRSEAKWRDLQLLRRSRSSLSIRVAILFGE